MDQDTPRGSVIRQALLKLAGVCLGLLIGPLGFVAAIWLFKMLGPNSQSRLVDGSENECGRPVLVDVMIFGFCAMIGIAVAVTARVCLVAARTSRRIVSNGTKDGEVI